MSDYLGDEDLVKLVRELNETAAEGGAAGAEARNRRDLRDSDPLGQTLLAMIQRQATDLLLVPGSSPVFRIDGSIVRSELPRLEAGDIRPLFAAVLTPKVVEAVERDGSADFTLRMAIGNAADRRRRIFRVNLHRQRGELSAAVRALPPEIPTLAGLNLPTSLADLVKTTRGLLLVCGPTGSGKTSTLAALVDEINRGQARHVITIEDPIEYEHRNQQSVVEQIEVGRDAPSFHTALRAALRQDPDVILVGEMRDLETVATAVSAAETGHLILSTLHTSDAAQAIHRIIDVFPAAQQTQIRQQLALSLHAIVCQQLIPRADGRGRIPAVELLLANAPVRQHIRLDRLQNIPNELTLGKRQGMILLEDSLATLAKAGRITPEEAQIRMRHPDDFRSYMAP